MKNMAVSVASVVSFLILAGNAPAQDEVSLSLPEALRTGIERNLDIRAELYSPAMAEADIRKYRGVYEPHLTTNTSYLYSKIPLNGDDDGFNSKQEETQLDLGLYAIIPTGARVDAGWLNQWNHSRGPAAVAVDPLNPALGTQRIIAGDSLWQSNLYFQVSQPLLKNFGRDSTEIDIRVAEKSKEQSVDRLKNRLLDLSGQITTEYYNLHNLRQDLEVKRASLALARKVLSETQARVKAGVTPAMEILNAEFGVASREKDVIDAEKAVRNQSDLLRLLLQLDTPAEIVPADAPGKNPFAPDVEGDIAKAQKNRPDLTELRSQIASSELQTRNLRNLTLPDLNFIGKIQMNGADRSYDTNLERMSSGKYPEWTVGLKLDYPIGNSAARNDLIKNKLKTEQLKAQLRSKEETVAKEVRTSGREVSASYKQLEVSDRQRAFAEERLRAFMKKSEVGLATIREVLEVENELTQARSAQIRALVDYNNAVTNYLKTTGDLLDAEKIRISSSDSDKLYRQAND